MLCSIAMLAAFAGNAQAIYKCTTSKGVVYQDRPCREGTETDVQIVIPTGELATKGVSAQDDPTQGNVLRPENRFGAPRQHLGGDEPASTTKPADNRASTAASAEEARKADARAVAENAVPMTADQARKTDASAKYYTTDVSAAGTETPEHMTCESPTGEKRRFVLTNGKLTSI
jgi:type IV secretory pathway VirB10-like protein